MPCLHHAHRHLDWSLPAHRRGTLSGMDAAPEPTRTYLRRVLRWWAGKGPAANPRLCRSGALTARRCAGIGLRTRPLVSRFAKRRIHGTQGCLDNRRLTALKQLTSPPGTGHVA
ncbi:hypothetical protein XaCFBP7622_11530 [Xanthomonas arboricola]|nr:hypothetical protein XaCFBP7622_11530 [Xanthomonas arboricola]